MIQADPPPDPKTYLHRAGPARGRAPPGSRSRWCGTRLEVRRLKRRLGLDEPIVEMFSNDERLADLTSWNPAAEGAAPNPCGRPSGQIRANAEAHSSDVSERPSVRRPRQ